MEKLVDKDSSAPLVSIITVAYNSAETIEATLASVDEQSYKNIEHVIVDGNSTDNTLEIVNRYASSSTQSIRVISESDRGIYDAMNKGIKAASGLIIATLNSDDIYANETIVDRVVQVMQQESLDALFGDIDYFSQDNFSKSIRLYKSHGFSSKSLEYGKVPAHPSLFLRREIFAIYGVYKPNYQIAGDFEYLARILKNNLLNYHYLPEIIVRMRIGGVSNISIKNRLLITLEIYKACKENGIKTNFLKLISRYPSKILEYIKAYKFSN
jgi:glycosyltransferase involved in cell wall biosynthesis